jgi:hypothetical protein
MKNLNTQLIILLAAVSLMGVGCSKKSKSSEPAPVVDVGVDGTVIQAEPPAGATGTSSTNEVAFRPVSLYEMNSYVGTHPLNNPSNIKIKVNLRDVGGGKYAGDVRISYTDNGYNYAGVFNTCLSSNCINQEYDSYDTSRDDGKNQAQYNYWFTMGGKQVFSGFFQDNYGAIILIVDNVVNQGDGQGGSVVSGQVWYRNFAQTFANQSTLRPCWFIYAGPYNCQSAIATKKTALYPTDTFRKLGDFSGLSFTNN